MKLNVLIPILCAILIFPIASNPIKLHLKSRRFLIDSNCTSGICYIDASNNTQDCPQGCLNCSLVSGSVDCSTCNTTSYWLNPDTSLCDQINNCATNGYRNATTNQCFTCPKNCSSCQWNDTNNTDQNNITCKSCDSSFELNETTGTCELQSQNCSGGKYLSPIDKACHPCPDNCSACQWNDTNNTDQNNITCTSCNGSNVLNETTGTCGSQSGSQSQNCSSGEYLSPIDNGCHPCPDNCSACQWNDTNNTDQNNITCTSCNGSNVLNETTGTCGSQSGSQSQNCSSGEYLSPIDNGCHPCPDNCSACQWNDTNNTDQNNITCTSCNGSNVLNETTGTCGSQSGSQSQNCSSGKYLSPIDNGCHPCPENCSTCQWNDTNNTDQNNITCTSCNGTNVLNDTTGTCESQSGSQSQNCSSGKYLKAADNDCHACPNNCSKCHEENGTAVCTLCQNGTFLNSTAKICAIIPKCNKSATFYNPLSNQCQGCPENCTKCKWDVNNSANGNISCSSCNNVSFANATDKSCEAIPHCNNASYYNSSDNACVNCPDNCTSCVANASLVNNNGINCTSCSANSFPNINNGSCDVIPICDNGSYYKSIDNTCESCPTNCTVCVYDANLVENNNVNCTSCNPLAFANTSAGTCEPRPNCSNGTYYNNSDNTCKSCPENCTTCHLSNQTVKCDSCNAISWFNQSQSTCDEIPICENATYYNGSNNTCNACPNYCSKCNVTNETIACQSCETNGWFDEATSLCDLRKN